MNCVGIDVSKGKSMIAVMRPFAVALANQISIAHIHIGCSHLKNHSHPGPG